MKSDSRQRHTKNINESVTSKAFLNVMTFLIAAINAKLKASNVDQYQDEAEFNEEVTIIKKMATLYSEEIA